MKNLLTTLSTVVLLSAALAAQTHRETSTPMTAPKPTGTSGSSSGTATAGDAARPRPTDVAADYKLVPGDKLRIEVYKDAQLSQSVQIRPDGKITLPLANDVAAAGRTPGELRDAIAESLKPYMASPTVTVMVVETVPPVIYVMGEVNHAGPQPLNGRMDVVQALSAAGGFKDFAKTKDIKIRRGTQILKFNYKDAVEGHGNPVYLQPGDTIIVP